MKQSMTKQDIEKLVPFKSVTVDRCFEWIEQSNSALIRQLKAHGLSVVVPSTCGKVFGIFGAIKSIVDQDHSIAEIEMIEELNGQMDFHFWKPSIRVKVSAVCGEDGIEFGNAYVFFDPSVNVKKVNKT